MTWSDSATADIIDTFGVSATYFPQVGAQSTVTVDFVREARAIEAEDGGLQTFEASLTAKTTDMPGAMEGDEILIGGTMYRFEVVEPDGFGASLVTLSKLQ